MDTKGNISEFKTKAVTKWSLINIPLAEFKQTDVKHLESFVIRFGYNGDGKGGGICIDEISFAP